MSQFVFYCKWRRLFCTLHFTNKYIHMYIMDREREMDIVKQRGRVPLYVNYQSKRACLQPK